jgi:YD repeat-containing protein
MVAGSLGPLVSHQEPATPSDPPATLPPGLSPQNYFQQRLLAATYQPGYRLTFTYDSSGKVIGMIWADPFSPRVGPIEEILTPQELRDLLSLRSGT